MERSTYEMNRRSALRLGAGGMLGAALSGGPLARVARGQGAVTPQQTKLLHIFIRGGWDGCNVVIPHGDSAYNSTNRPTIYISPSPGVGNSLPIETGNTFAELHPSLSNTFNGGLPPILNNDHLVLLHQVGLIERTGSHFADQRTWETGITPCRIPFNIDQEEGWKARMAELLLAPGFRGASVSNTLQQGFQTKERDRVLAHVRQILDTSTSTPTNFYTLDSALSGLDAQYRGVSASAAPPFGYGLKAHYESPGYGQHVLEPLGRGAGDVLLSSETALAALGTTYTPGGGAKYPFNQPGSTDFPDPTTEGMPGAGWVTSFFRQLRDALWILKNTDARVAGVQLGGVDTHSNQGSTSGPLADRLNVLAYGLRSVYLDSQSDPTLFPSLTTMVVSEFGRTSAENASQGTDHGAGTVAMIMGSRVVLNGSSRVFGCDSGTWPGMFSANAQNLGCTPTAGGTGNFVYPGYHAFGVYAQVLSTLFGASPGQLAQILPGYSAASHTLPTFIA